MIGSDLLNIIRADILRDSALPYLWSDATVYRYLSEGQELHARETYSILDDTPTVATVIGTASYALPATTMFVLSARVSTSANDLRNYTRKAIPSHLLTSTGEPQIYSLDEATGVIRFYPVPDAIITVNLRVARLPSADVVAAGTPEIPARYHMDLIHFVAAQCLISNDVDGQNMKAADRHKAQWDLRLSNAKREIYRMQLGNNPSAVRSWTGKRN